MSDGVLLSLSLSYPFFIVDSPWLINLFIKASSECRKKRTKSADDKPWVYSDDNADRRCISEISSSRL